MTSKTVQNSAIINDMFPHGNYRSHLNRILRECGIHATQITDGFSVAENFNYNTDPSIYTMDAVFHSFGASFRLLRAQYLPGEPTKVLHRQQKACKPPQSIYLLPNITIETLAAAKAYIRAANDRAQTLLLKHDLPATAQNRGTLLGLAAYRCTEGMPGSIAALPDCYYNERVYDDVYFPFIRAGATLSMIVEACAWRVGQQGPITYLLGHVPVRFGTLDITADSHGLASLKLGPYQV